MNEHKGLKEYLETQNLDTTFQSHFLGSPQSVELTLSYIFKGKNKLKGTVEDFNLPDEISFFIVPKKDCSFTPAVPEDDTEQDSLN